MVADISQQEAWVDRVVNAVGKLAEPARSLGFYLASCLPDGKTWTDGSRLERAYKATVIGAGPGRAFAALPEVQKRKLLSLFFPDLVDPILLAFAARGEIPALLDGTYFPIRRAPSHPDVGDESFFAWLFRIADTLRFRFADAPKVRVDGPAIIRHWLAEGSAGAPEAIGTDLGMLVGFAADLPGALGQRVFDALIKAGRETGGNHETEAFVVAALLVGQRPEGWQQLAKWQAAGRINIPDDRCSSGRLAAARFMMETSEARLGPRNPATKCAQAQLRMLDPAARQKALASNSVADIGRALRIQALIDRAGIAEPARRLLASADPIHQALGVLALGYYALPGEAFPVELLDAADDGLMACAIAGALAGDADLTAPDAMARLENALERVHKAPQGQIDIPKEVRGGFPQPTPGSFVHDGDIHDLMIRAVRTGPLDPLLRHIKKMAFPGKIVDVLEEPQNAARTLTKIEVGFLGYVLKVGGYAWGKGAENLLRARGISPDKAKAAFLALPKPAKAKGKPHDRSAPRQGPWVKVMEKRASATDETFKYRPPATTAVLAGAEKKLGLMLPQALRELLLEANGILDSTEDDARFAIVQPTDMLIQSTENVRADREIYDEKPDVTGIVFFVDLGNGDYVGICSSDVGKFKAGAVVLFDHEKGEIEKKAKDLKAYLKQEEM